MTKPADELDSAGYDVADAYRDGKLADLKGTWDDPWAGLRAELARRCPGFTREEYDAALAAGFQDSR